MSEGVNWSRRGFLSARGLGASAGGALGTLLADGIDNICWQRPRLEVCYSRRAMGCEFNVFCRPTEPQGMAAADAALDEIRQLEELLTVYCDSSPMVYINHHAHPGPVVADGRIVELLQRAEELTRLTDGGFDVAAGALVRAWGFLKGPRRVPSDQELEAARTCSGMRHVELDAEQRTVRYRVPGLQINMGALGKGYAIDRAARRMSEEYGVTSALIQGGLSSTYAMGSASDEEDGWLVGIQNPFDTSKRIATVRLRDRALGTSAANRQYFEADGQRLGHILDPRTGRPAVTDLACVSVLAPDAATADALSTGLYVLGLDKTRAFCHNHPEIAALVVLQPEDSSRTPTRPQVMAFNLTKKVYQLEG